MSFGKEIWHGIRQALRAGQYCCYYLWNTWLYVVFLHIRRGSTMLPMCPWEFHHCMYVTSSPRELTSCLLPGHICTNRLRFRRQLMWTPSPPPPPSKKWSSFRGLFFREQPSEPFREDSIESTVHEPFSDTDWWSAGWRKIILISLLYKETNIQQVFCLEVIVKIYIHIYIYMLLTYF